MTCMLPTTARAGNCKDCAKCSFNKQVEKARRGHLRKMNNIQLANFMLAWKRGEAWK